MKGEATVKRDYKFYLKITFAVLISATLLFIFINSALPPELSSEESDKVGGFISSIIPPDTTLGQFVLKYIRKIAHFTEYGMLGIEFALMIRLLARRRGRCFSLSLTVPLFVGFTDESIQILSGRGPSISDVWIDIGGYVFFGTIAYYSLCLIELVYKKIKLKNNGKEA